MTGLAVRACGMTTAIGLTGPAACAALRARLDNFRETRFISRDGEWILGAEAPLAQPWRGLERLVQLVLGPLRECLAEAHAPPAEIPLLLCLAERERPGRVDRLDEVLVARLAEALGHGFGRGSRVYAFGQVGGAVALRDARALVDAGAREVLIAGVDCFLVADTLRLLDREDRLLTAANSNGFIAGEAGAAVLIGQGDRGPRLAGLGFGAEAARIDTDLPQRAEGLVRAMRQALDEAGVAYNDIGFRIADLGGEQYYFREAALAQARLWRGKRDPEEVWTPSDGMGHTGAAFFPVALGLALTAARKGYAPGRLALVHSAHDDGRRAAAVLAIEG
jgi:3-oxoacyl-[acyl-carrier-protein] synthase-1